MHGLFNSWRKIVSWAGLAALLIAGMAYLAVAGERKEDKKLTDKSRDLTHMTDTDLRKTLTPEQFHVCKENGTEPPFRNAYWNNHEPGLYVDIISGDALFASVHKFDSGTGWPSFWQPLEKKAGVEKTDDTHGMSRTEVRSAKSDSHLGHVFPDGPKPTGMRYCINSAALRFVPLSKL